MPNKIRLQGAVNRVVRITSDSSPLAVTVAFASGEELPEGDLYATATSQGDTLSVDVEDATGSDGIVTVVATIDPVDFEEYGARIWAFEIGVLDEGSTSGDSDDTAYVMFSGSVVFSPIIPNVIATTTIQEAAS